jgi:flagella basal body P-ring formation protein FlgA
LREIIGKKARHDLKKGTPLRCDMFSWKTLV